MISGLTTSGTDSQVAASPCSTITANAETSGSVGSASNAQAGGQPAVPSVLLQDSREIVWDLPKSNGRSVPVPAKREYPAGNTFNPDNGILNRLYARHVETKYPIRDSLRPKQGKSVITNHFEVVVNPAVKFYQYCITGISGKEKRSTKRRYIETAIQKVPFLQSNRDHFATDYVDTIISWKDLHSLAPGPKVGSYDDNVPGSADEWRLIDVIDRNVTVYLNLRLIGTVDFTAFRDYINSNHNDPGQYNPEPTRRALHIVMSHCINDQGNVFHLNANKFFVTDAFTEHTLLPRWCHRIAVRSALARRGLADSEGLERTQGTTAPS
jgi:hypothetical protein